MNRKIWMWHGFSQNLVDKINNFCEYDEKSDSYYWSGSLDEFERNYKDKFIVMGACIAITQFASFGQR